MNVIFLDVDGTLFWNELGPFADDIDAIIEARKAGHYVFLNTGRSLANLPFILSQAQYLDGFVLGAGSHVIFRGKTIYSVHIDEQKVLDICEYYLKSKKWCVFEGETGVFAVHLESFTLFPADVPRIDRADDFLTKYKGERITKITIDGELTQDDKNFLGDFFELTVFDRYFEGIIKGHNKLFGIDIVLKELGLSRENAIAIGDSLNDMDMVRGSGLGIAMGNACDELKRAAKVVTLDCRHGGVADAIRRYVPGKE